MTMTMTMTMTDKEIIKNACEKKWLNKSYCLRYEIKAKPAFFSNIYKKEWKDPYETMKNELIHLSETRPRHIRVESRDKNSCLRSLSINPPYLIAHFRSQNEIVRKYDERYLYDIFLKLKIKYKLSSVFVTVEEYLFGEERK